MATVKILISKIENIMKDRGGFTLIEIMVATVIASIMMVLLYSAYKNTFTSIKRTSGLAEFYENVNLAMSKISRDIANTYYDRNNKNIQFLCKVDGDNSRIDFVTVDFNPYRLSGNIKETAPYSDVKEVGYYCKDDPQINDLKLLMKRESLHYDDVPDAGGGANLLLENVKELKFEMRQGNDWTDSWDSSTTKRFPEAVRTTLIVKNYQGKEEAFRMVTNLNITKKTQ